MFFVAPADIPRRSAPAFTNSKNIAYVAGRCKWSYGGLGVNYGDLGNYSLSFCTGSEHSKAVVLLRWMIPFQHRPIPRRILLQFALSRRALIQRARFVPDGLLALVVQWGEQL